MLGYDLNRQVIIIKPLSKKEVIRGDIPEHTQYNISIGTTYARISNKAFLKRVEELFDLNLEDKGNKYKAIWRMNVNALEISLKEDL